MQMILESLVCHLINSVSNDVHIVSKNACFYKKVVYEKAEKSNFHSIPSFLLINLHRFPLITYLFQYCVCVMGVCLF